MLCTWLKSASPKCHKSGGGICWTICFSMSSKVGV